MTRPHPGHAPSTGGCGLGPRFPVVLKERDVRVGDGIGSIDLRDTSGDRSRTGDVALSALVTGLDRPSTMPRRNSRRMPW
jgi:hypothetical protein